MRNFERVIMPHTRQTRTTWRTRNSAAISYALILADLELKSLCVRNLMAISTRLNFLMTGTRDVLVKRLQQARSTRTASVLRATTKMAANTWTLPSNNNSTISSNGSRSYLTENLLRYFISWPVDTGAIDRLFKALSTKPSKKPPPSLLKPQFLFHWNSVPYCKQPGNRTLGQREPFAFIAF